MPPSTIKSRVLTLIPQTYSGWDNIGDIDAVLRQHEMGMMRQAAMLMDAIFRDDRASAVLSKRLDALDTVPLNIKPGNKSRKARKIAEDLGGLDDAPGMWDRMVPAETSAAVVLSGFMLGIGVAESLWSVDADRMRAGRTPGSKPFTDRPGSMVWRPRLQYVHPQHLRWDFTTRWWKMLTARGEIDLPRIDDDPTKNDGKWLIFMPYGTHELSWMRGLIRSIAPLYVERSWSRRDWARYDEIHGMPWRKAVVPPGAPIEEKNQYIEDVANLGNEPTVATPQSKDGDGYDVELISDGSKASTDTFERHKSDISQDMAVLVLGQNLTTEAAAGGLGGGQVDAHRGIERDKLRHDAGIATAIFQQQLIPYARYNWGDETLAPRPEYEVDPPEDQTQKGNAALALGNGIRALKDADIPVDEIRLAEEAGIPLLSPEEIAAREAVEAEEAAANPPPPGLNANGEDQQQPDPNAEDDGGDGNGGDQGGNDGGDGAGDTPPKKKGAAMSAASPRARAETLRALIALAGRSNARRVQLRAKAKPHHPDDLVARAVPLAARALAVDLAAIKEEVTAAESFDDLQKRITERFAKMDPKALETIVARTRILANLSGRLAVSEHVGPVKGRRRR